MSRGHSPAIPSLHLRHNSFSTPSVGLPTSQLILQPFHCFIYVTVVHSSTLLSVLLGHKFFTNSPDEKPMIVLEAIQPLNCTAHKFYKSWLPLSFQKGQNCTFSLSHAFISIRLVLSSLCHSHVNGTDIFFFS